MERRRQALKRWLTIGVETTVAWPTSEAAVSFEGQRIFLRPGSETAAPCIDIHYDDPLTDEGAYDLIQRFMSSLAWVEGARIRQVMALGSGVRTSVGHGMGARIINPNFKADYLPSPADEKQRLALALYREALSVNVIAYQFLGYFKIINILYSTTQTQEEWVNKTAPLLAEFRARERIAELALTEPDIGHYLYVSGRCAIAHAFSQPVVDPDSREDQRRLSRDLPLIRALAEHLIEHELGIKSRVTIRREHLYELAGFKKVLGGEDHVERLLKGESPFPAMPRLSLRIRGHAPFPMLEDLDAVIREVKNGCVAIRCTSRPPVLTADVRLSFPSESLEFHPHYDVEVQDDGSEHAVQAVMDAYRLLAAFLANGELEVWSASSGERLGRKDAHIPANIDLGRTLDSLEETIRELQVTLELRRRHNG
jgi:hypothetical protein